MMKHVAAATALLATPLIAVSACANQASDNSSTSTSTSSGSNADELTTQLNTADGKHIADATIDFTDGYATVTVETAEAGILSPGLHSLHIHAVGACEANSVAPSGGPSADFASAGDHFQAPGHTGAPASGDLPALLVRSDGSGKLVATSDAFTADQLKGSEGSSIVLHEGADTTGTNGQNSGAVDTRIACGVLSPASTASTSVSTSTSTSTVTSAVPPPATITETPSSTPPTSSSSTSTSTSTVTVTEPTVTTTAPPPPPAMAPGPGGG